MQQRTAARPASTITAEEAAGLVHSGMWLDFGGSIVQPDAFEVALSKRAKELKNVKVRACLSVRPHQILAADPEGTAFHLVSWHFSLFDRLAHDEGRCTYAPLNLGEVPDYYRRFIDPIDIIVIKAAPPDAQGWLSTGPTNVWLRAAIERCKCLIIELWPQMPLAEGQGNRVHISEVDYLIEAPDAPPFEMPSLPSTEVDRAVATMLVNEIGDGACIQIGIGAMPNAVCSLLAQNAPRDLGIHTEMLTNGIIDLYKTGQVTGARKQIDQGKIVYTFALGDKHMYRTLGGNQDFCCYPVDYTNSPDTIARNHNVIAINNTTQIDLQGQAASESDGHRHLTGTGGQLQFVRGAYQSPGGKSFLLLSSVYERKGMRKSRIVLNLTPGNIVTTPRSDQMYIVTEYGMTCLKGRSVAERALALIKLAHPDFRDELERQAYDKRLIPRGFTFGQGE
ncbi:MAG TPA: 4-hydroxybutyrate CoA-transferase [Alphaproteobacteria bacterium]|nr:4-hydroxybutyrate CoA-transferase [Alphaproteobacteria bacterium]HAJ48758.1 4-hydroxybutyrate CoA-transferase [Alphaproteobacteria bacterium]